MIASVRALLVLLLALAGAGDFVALRDYSALHPGQWEIAQDDTKFQFLVCGRGWGKDHFAIFRICEAISTAGPGFRVCYVGPSHDQIRDIAWDRLKDAIPEHFIIGKPHETRLEIRLRWGPLIQLRGSDNVLRGRGPDNNLLIVTEYAHCRPEVWPALSPTLRFREDRALIITTPSGPNHAYEHFRAVQGNKLWKTWQKPTRENPLHDAEKLASDFAWWSRQLYNQEYEAQFLSNVGAVYHDFSPLLHVVAGLELDLKIPQYIVGQDFNAGHYCAVIGQLRPTPTHLGPGRIEIVDEVVTRTHIWDHLKSLREYFGAKQIDHRTRVVVFTDASGDYNATSKVTADVNLFKKDGFRCMHDPQNPPQIDRVHAVQSGLLPGDGKPRLVISDRCPELQYALMRQKWGEYGKPEKKGGLDDNTDSLGYLVWGVAPIRPRPTVGAA